MIIPVEDTSYRCKDCDSFGQCEYYNHRRPDSHICKEFRNDWKMKYKMVEILDKISAEIKSMEYHMIDCEVLVSQEEVLDIIEKYKGDKEC